MIAKPIEKLPTRAYLGWVFQLNNPRLHLDLKGAPREILEKLTAAHLSPKVLNAAESQVKAALFHADAIPAKFRGSSQAGGIMQVLDALATGDFGRADSIIDQDPQLLGGEHDAAAVPLNQFAVLGAADRVKFLIDRGAVINRPHHLGMTALHWAAATGRAEVVDVLIDAGADPTLQSWFMLTPAQLADANKHRQVADRLSKTSPEALDGWKMMEVLKRMGAM